MISWSKEVITPARNDCQFQIPDSNHRARSSHALKVASEGVKILKHTERVPQDQG